MLRSRFSWITAACLILTAAFFAGCSLDSGNPMAPAVDDSDGFVTLDQAADQPEFVKMAPESGQVLAKPLGLFGKHTEKKVKKNRGGWLLLTDLRTTVSLRIKRNSIPQDETISITLPEGDMLVIGVGGEDGLTFGPHGLIFDPSAELTIVGRNLVLPEGDLYVYCMNEATGEWEATDQKVEVRIRGRRTTLKAKIPHFSHYAFGARR